MIKNIRQFFVNNKFWDLGDCFYVGIVRYSIFDFNALTYDETNSFPHLLYMKIVGNFRLHNTYKANNVTIYNFHSANFRG